MEKFRFHLDVEDPKDLELISSVYLHPDVKKGFSDRDCANIFISKRKPYLYGFNESGCVRCDHK